MNSETDLKRRIHKQPYDKKNNNEDGLLLKVHHTTPGPTGDIRRTRFIFASFSSCNELLAVADHRGNIFVIDLTNSVFWLLGKQLSISLLSFHPRHREDLLVGTKECSLLLLNSETSHQLGCLRGHTEAPISVSYSSGADFCMSIASCEGFIWDLKTLTQAHRLNLQPDMQIKMACFMPVSDNILACFQDDAIHIWAFPSFQCVKQIVPDSWKGHNIKSIAFTRNGRAMVLGGKSGQLVIFSVDDWNTQRVVNLPDNTSKVLHLEFLPQAFDSGANQILMVLTGCESLLFVNLATEVVVSSRNQKNIRNFTCSGSGKYIVCNTADGEAKIFSGSQLLANAMRSDDVKPIIPKEKAAQQESSPPPIPKPLPKLDVPKKHHSIKKCNPKVNQQMESVFNLNRLRPILKEFLEFPEQYRGLIWRSILQLPGNRELWASLSERPLHPAAQALSGSNPIQNKIAFHCLQSVISCLAYWSPVFAEIPYLPHFVFPFIKIFHSDKFVCFEVAATLIINWCQHWFEYLSFPPVNILGMVENVLSEHDMELITIFCNARVTSRQYAWSLLSSAFSEVLTSGQWKQLWDHILSNPPWFLLFAVVAYNICCRATLKTCSSKEDFEFFFKNQNPINMKYFIKKCYELMETTSEENQPSHHLNAFTPLSKGTYPVFSDYPKFIVNYQKEQRDAIQHEEENILKEQQMILSQRLAREEVRLRERKARVEEGRLIEAEKAANAALQVEETRLMDKRRQLAALRRELRAQEENSLASARVEAMEHQVKQRSAELDRLHYQLHERTRQAGLDKEGLNEEVHDQFSRLNVRKQELQQRLGEYRLRELARPVVESLIPNQEFMHLKQQQRLLSEEIQKLRKESSVQGLKTVDLDVMMAELDSIYQRVEVAVANKAFMQQDLLINAEQCLEEAHAATKLKKLETEVDKLALKLSSIRNSDDPHARCKSDETERLLLNRKDPVICFKPQEIGGAFAFRSAEFYRKENCAVSSAMELRKSLLSSWNTT